MVIDAHVHVGGPPPISEPENFVELMDNSGIDKSVICRYIPGEPTLAGNELVFSVLRRYPDRFVGFVWVDPNSGTAVREIEKAVNEWGFKGVKLHLEAMPAPENKLRLVFSEAEKLNMPIYIHAGKDLGVVGNLCQDFEVKIVLGHLGVGVYNLNPSRLGRSINLAKKQNDLYLETSGNTYFFIEHALKRLGASKLIFGSDFPHEHPAVLLKTIELLKLNNNEEDMILEGNIITLIDT